MSEQAELLRTMKADDATRWSELDTRLSAIDSKLHDALGQREGYARAPSVWSAAPPGSSGSKEGGDAANSGDTGAGPAAQPESGETAASAAGAAIGDSASQASDEADTKRVYEQAYKDLTRGNYSLAVLGFREFLKRSPSSDLSDNAQYWVGECFYAQRDFNQAAQEFLKVEELYPKGDKVPAALLKTGYSFLQLDDKANARRYLNEVIEKFPNSEEAVSARNKLRSAM